MHASVDFKELRKEWADLNVGVFILYFLYIPELHVSCHGF